MHRLISVILYNCWLWSGWSKLSSTGYFSGCGTWGNSASQVGLVELGLSVSFHLGVRWESLTRAFLPVKWLGPKSKRGEYTLPMMRPWKDIAIERSEELRGSWFNLPEQVRSLFLSCKSPKAGSPGLVWSTKFSETQAASVFLLLRASPHCQG